MAAYTTAPAADAVALEIGQPDFVDVDDKGATLAANGAASASATALPFDGLSVAGAVSKNDILQNGDEILLVQSVTYNPGNLDGVANVKRGAYGTTAAPIADNAILIVKNLKKISLLETATQEIVGYHKQTWPSGALWYNGNASLARACALRAIYLMQYGEARSTAEYIRNVSAGSYSDTVISVSSAGNATNLDGATQSIVDSVLQFAGIAVGEYGRA
ncbi:MAG: hypothetical protein IPJ01_12055 [Micavibrio sp.]|nr:hypothetical protein [Micavibrio sp.]